MIDLESLPRDLKNLSVSRIEKALLCPRAFRLQHIDRIPQVSSGRFLAGNVIHEILENALKQHARTGKYPEWQELDDQFESTWKSKAAEEENRDSFIGWQWDPDDPEEKVKAGYRPLIRIAREQILSSIKAWKIGNEPVVEHRIDLELTSDVGPFSLIGYIDLLEDSGILMDWKTTEKKVSDRAREMWLQFAAYSLWAYPIVGEENLRCRKVFLVRGSKPFWDKCDYIITPKHREYFVRTAAEVWKMIQAGAFPPITETWLCSPKFCSFYSGCQGELDCG